MKYKNITPAIFLNRPNRFIAEVEIDGKREIVHVKNTGRCKELLIPGCKVWLDMPGTPGRKTKYDLVAVLKENNILINMDSQAPNKVAKEWLESQSFDVIIPEYTYGASRIDFYMEKHMEGKEPTPYLMEVKGCTLEREGIGYFPDAPTERGIKHIKELIKAKEAGINAILAFVIQMDGVTEVRANMETHPEFGLVLEEAGRAGVEILFLPCHVEEDRIECMKGIIY